MKLVALSLALVTGCSTAASAVGGLLSPKPPNVTVVTKVELPAPAPAPAPAKESHATRDAVIVGVVAGVVVGGAVGYALHAAL